MVIHDWLSDAISLSQILGFTSLGKCNGAFTTFINAGLNSSSLLKSAHLIIYWNMCLLRPVDVSVTFSYRKHPNRSESTKSFPLFPLSSISYHLQVISASFKPSLAYLEHSIAFEDQIASLKDNKENLTGRLVNDPRLQ